MRVVTFAPSLTAEEQEGGGLTLKGFPMNSAFVDVFPAEVTIPIVLVVAGEDYGPVEYITYVAFAEQVDAERSIREIAAGAAAMSEAVAGIGRAELEEHAVRLFGQLWRMDFVAVDLSRVVSG